MKLVEAKALKRGEKVYVEYHDDDCCVSCPATVVCVGDEVFENGHGKAVMVVVMLGEKFVAFPSFNLTNN